ncbi:MAG: prephenate dehydrogenase/arogenate dehydrogenase family protein [Candidatus Bathyarchaeota archaeon]|nr:prephenate dehydrogenase/arogenate dehydrogenase family protein [Candidatus Bathyarchaeota archaeon]
MKTAVLGAGKMGAWFANYCKQAGDSVVLADRKQTKLDALPQDLGVELETDFTQAIQGADRILICVSISAFEEVIKKISPALKPNQVVMDICSIKDYPVKVMHENIQTALTLGTHPVFGPGSHGLKHKAYILTPTNDAEAQYAEKFKNWLQKEGANVFVMSPKKHDELMSMVLGLPHFLGLVACETLLEQPAFSETKQVAGTTYRMLFTLAEATAMETPDVYASLQTKLPELSALEDQFIAKAQAWLDILKQKNPKAITEHIEQIKAKLLQTDPEFAKSYQTMYKMLESTEN